MTLCLLNKFAQTDVGRALKEKPELKKDFGKAALVQIRSKAREKYLELNQNSKSRFLQFDNFINFFDDGDYYDYEDDFVSEIIGLFMDFLFTIDRDEFWENVLGENSEQLRPAIESIMAILVPDIDECVISTFEAYYDDMLMQSAAQGVLALYLGEIFNECFDEDNENIMCDIDFDAGSIPLTVFEGILNAKCDDNDAEMYKANLLLQCPNGIPEIDLPELNVSIKNFKSCIGGDSECGYAISYVDAVLRLAENIMAYFDID